MDFSKLPYELQFQYLLDLPYQEIVRYCQSSRAAYEICQTEEFWNHKAIHDFGLSLSFIPEGSYAQRYARLLRRYQQGDEKIVSALLERGEIARALKLLKRALPHLEPEDEPFYLGTVLMAALDSGRADILESVLRVLSPYLEPYNVVNGTYYEALKRGRTDLADLLMKYQPELDYILYDAIIDGEIPVVEYLRKLVPSDPEEELRLALGSTSSKMTDYFVKLYPHLLQDRTVVNRMAESFVEDEDLPALQRLVTLAQPLIDFQHLRQSHWAQTYPIVWQYLSQF